jgi:hypothetical protein
LLFASPIDLFFLASHQFAATVLLDLDMVRRWND